MNREEKRNLLIVIILSAFAGSMFSLIFNQLLKDISSIISLGIAVCLILFIVLFIWWMLRFISKKDENNIKK